MPFDGDVRNFQAQPDVVREGLIIARDAIKSGWCQGSVARDKSGDRVDSATSRTARSVCAMGALFKAQHDIAIRHGLDQLVAHILVDRMIDRIAEADGKAIFCRFTVIEWNDASERTQDEVIELFQRAVDHTPELVHAD